VEVASSDLAPVGTPWLLGIPYIAPNGELNHPGAYAVSDFQNVASSGYLIYNDATKQWR
jgi:hypothetical protein